jgi:hypothetical protein
MRSCKNCKYSAPYFRGLLCYWVEDHIHRLDLPPYLQIVGTLYEGLEGCYPKQIDETDYGNVCSVYEEGKNKMKNENSEEKKVLGYSVVITEELNKLIAGMTDAMQILKELEDTNHSLSDMAAAWMDKYSYSEKE